MLKLALTSDYFCRSNASEDTPLTCSEIIGSDKDTVLNNCKKKTAKMKLDIDRCIPKTSNNDSLPLSCLWDESYACYLMTSR